MLKIGKIPPEILNTAVYPFLGEKRKEVLVHSSFGEDCSIIDFGEKVAVLSSDPITGADKLSAYLSVFVACNDLAACGAVPIGILVTLLFPENSSENTVRDVMENIHKACLKIGIEVLGGHSEVTGAVNKTIISTTAIGVASKQNYITSSGAKPGDDVIVTKYIGMEGTAILATDFEDVLLGFMDENKVKEAQKLIENISVIDEGITASSLGASAMHDITEGGILGAAYEIAKASNVGIEIYIESVPILEVTKEICKIFNINPLGLISSGSMLICAKNGQKIVEELNKCSINAKIIGKITDSGKCFLVKSGIKTEFMPFERDELFVAIENAKKFLEK